MITYGVLRLHAHDLTVAARRCYHAAKNNNVDETRRQADLLQQDLDLLVEDIRKIHTIIEGGETVPD